MNDQGANSIQAFHGKGQAGAIYEFYGKSASLFADIIRTNLTAGKYTLADLGGHKGELVSDVTSLLPEYQFGSIVIDKVVGLDDNSKAQKIVGNIIDNELPDKGIDVVLMRYVLPWDKYENQKLILKEVQRVCKGIAIVQHQGAPSNNAQQLHEASKKLWSGIVPALKRENGFFTEGKQVESWMDELGIKFERISEKHIETLSESFIEKFNLNQADAETTKEILKGCDGLTITTWLLRF